MLLKALLDRDLPVPRGLEDEELPSAGVGGRGGGRFSFTTLTHDPFPAKARSTGGPRVAARRDKAGAAVARECG